MIECEVFFYKDDPLGLKHQKRNGKAIVLEQESVHCFVLAREHNLHLHSEKDAYDPFYKVNPLTIYTEIDPKTNILTIKRRKKDEIIMKIKSSRDNIERIADFCEENSDEEKLYHPLYYTPCDQHRESYLSVPHKLSKYRGFLNFFLVTAIFSRIRDLVDNVSTYGILPPQTLNLPKAEEILSGPIVICTSTLWMIIVEKLAFKGIFPKPLVHILEILNIGAAFGYSIYFILHFEPNPLFGLVYLTWTTMMLLKMISYVHVMSEVRTMIPKIKTDITKTWKDNEKRAFEASKENIDVIKRNLKTPSKIVSVKDILYFYHCPTLVYQLWYPRTPKIRWNLLGKWFLQFIPTWVFFAFWYNQFVIPAMNESGKAFKYGNFADRIKTVITVGNCFATLLPSFFYGTFHLLTNIIAEFLRYGDREFYKDFWNCRSIGQFWVSWNLPVHTWCKRHIYYPLIKRGFSKSFSGGMVFLFSGGVHEYLFGLPLRVFGSTAIIGLFLQAPIIAIERKYDHYLRKSQVGNFIFWVLTWFLLCPYGVTHYYASYLIKYNYV